MTSDGGGRLLPRRHMLSWRSSIEHATSTPRRFATAMLNLYGFISGQRRTATQNIRRWVNIKPTLVKRFVFATRVHVHTVDLILYS